MTVEDNVKVGLHNQERTPALRASCACPATGSTRRPPTSAPWSCCPSSTWRTWPTKAGSLPYGAQRRLEIRPRACHQPSLLLLDEPAAGMNPSETAELMENIGKIRDTFEIAIMLIEHDMNLVMNICEGIAC